MQGVLRSRSLAEIVPVGRVEPVPEPIRGADGVADATTRAGPAFMRSSAAHARCADRPWAITAHAGLRPRSLAALALEARQFVLRDELGHGGLAVHLLLARVALRLGREGALPRLVPIQPSGHVHVLADALVLTASGECPLTRLSDRAGWDVFTGQERRRGVRSRPPVVLAAMMALLALGGGRAISSPAASAASCRWKAAAVEDPHAHLFDRFDSVTVTPTGKAWAVGDYYTGHEGGQNGSFIEEWTGRRWHLVGRPLANADLRSVSASGDDNAWVAGDHLVEHWDGSAWRKVATARVPGRSGLAAVAARTPRDVWLVGSRWRGASSRAESLVEHWDGTRWSVVPARALVEEVEGKLAQQAVSSADRVAAALEGKTRLQDLSDDELAIVAAHQRGYAPEDDYWGLKYEEAERALLEKHGVLIEAKKPTIGVSR